MSTFRFVVEPASEEPMSVQSGGEIKIADLSVVSVERFEVEMPDTTAALAPQVSGTVEPIKPLVRNVADAPTGGALIIRSLSADPKLFRIVVLVVLVLFGLTFAAVAVNDIRRGKLDFQTYAMCIASFLAGKSMNKISSKDDNHGDGGG